MATIVKVKSSGEHLVLVGAGLGAYAGERVHWLYGDIDAEDDSKIISVVAAATSDGEIRWVPSADLSVVSVDGLSPADILDDLLDSDGP